MISESQRWAVTRLKQKVPWPVVKRIQQVRYIMGDRSSLDPEPGWPKILGRYDRLYFFHVRKTAGTSLISAFMNVRQDISPQQYAFMQQNGWLAHGEYVYVSHNRFLLERGDYFFGSSHLAMHELDVPADSFKLVILRDPVARVISHYRMLRHWRVNDHYHPARVEEDAYLGDGFTDFLDRFPPRHLLRQLYMFSEGLRVDEALDNLKSTNFIMMTEGYADQLETLGALLDLPLRCLPDRAGHDPVMVSARERSLLREAVAPEYELLAKVAPFVGTYRRHD